MIHAAAGGVGLAAVQLAAALGAVVFATAGSPAKRCLLRRLGARVVASSRDLSFVDDLAMVRIGMSGLSVEFDVHVSGCLFMTTFLKEVLHRSMILPLMLSRYVLSFRFSLSCWHAQGAIQAPAWLALHHNCYLGELILTR